MTSTRPFFSILAAAMLVGACSAMPRHQPATHGEMPVAEAGTATPLPQVPLSGDILYQLLVADIAVQRKDYAIAIRRYLRLAKQTRDPRIAGMAARMAIYVRDNPRALEAAVLWVKLAADDPQAQQAVIAAYIRNGQAQAAIPHIDALLAMKGQGAQGGLRLLSSLLSREQDVNAALSLMKHVAEQRPDNPYVMIAYGQLALRAGDLGVAEKMISRVLKMRPGWSDAILLQVRIMQLRGKAQAGLEYLAKAVEKAPGDLRLRLFYARLLMDEKRYEVALVQYRQLARLSPQNVELKYTLGLLLLQLKYYDEAQGYLLQIKRSGVRFNEVNFYLGWIAENKGNIKEAIGYYSAVTASANYLEAKVRWAVLTAKQGHLQQARAELATLRREVPAHQRRLYLVEGEILQSAGSDAEAMKVYSEALQQMPKDLGLLYAQAIVAEKLGRMKLMEHNLRRIIDQDPNNVDALNALGYTLADHTERYREAFTYIKRALALRPNSNAILDSMGWVLYRMGDYKEAIKYLRRSIKIKMDYEVAAHLGEVLWVSGDQKEAMTVWHQALEQFSGNKTLLDIIKRFNH